MNGMCLHELVANDIHLKEKVKTINSFVTLYREILRSYDPLPIQEYDTDIIKILNRSYLKHKSQVKIYLFQDQFLI